MASASPFVVTRRNQPLPVVTCRYVLVFFCVLFASWPEAQTQRGPLASQRVLGNPIVAIDAPMNDHSVFDAAQQLLRVADVRFGIEGPALDPAVPLVDFGKPVENIVVLTGLTLGDALDRLAAGNPRFHWREADGMIQARVSSAGPTLTDRRLPGFVLVNASPRAALEALIKAVAPARGTAGIMGMGRPAAGREGGPPTRVGKDVSVSLDKPTVLDVLNAVSRENGAMSWTIRYERAPATIDTATIAFSESGEYATAVPPGMVDPTAPQPGNAVRVSVFSDLATMLAQYREQTGVLVNFELLPPVPGPRSSRSMPPLTLTGLPPAAAVRRIVAHDSRYEVVERSGRFLVKPRAGGPHTSPLDTVLPSFVRVDEPFDAAVGGLLQRLSLESSSTGSFQSGGGRGSNTAAIEAIRQKPVSVSFPKPTTVRDVLDALCAAAGPLSWSLRAQSVMSGRSFYNLEISSPEGWTLPKSFVIATPTTPSRRPEPGIPANLDRDINRVSFPTTPAPISPFLTLASSARIPVGIELAPSELPRTDPRFMVRPDMTMLGPGKLSDAIYVLLERMPDTGWIASGGMLNFGPASTIRQPGHFLNRPIGRFDVSGVPARDVVKLLRQRMAGSGSPTAAAAPTGGAPPMAVRTIESLMSQPVTLALENPTPRDVLNAIALRLNNVSWIVMYEAPAAGQAARPRDEDAVIVVGVNQSWALDGIRFNRDGTTAAVVPIRPSLPTGPRMTIELPITERTWPYSIGRVCQAVSIRCTVELVATTPSNYGPAVYPPPTAQYDFTGMAAREALDKLVQLAPDLSWRLDGDVYRIASRSLEKATNLPLDERIPSIEQKLETLSAVSNFLRNYFVPPPAVSSVGRRGGPLPPGAATGVVGGVVGGIPGGTPPSQTQTVLPRDRTVVISLKNATVRQFLDEVAKQHGDLTWSVRYLDANGTYPQFELTLSGSNYSTGTSINVR